MTGIADFLLQPPVFFGCLFILLAVFLALVRDAGRRQKLARQDIEELLGQARKKIGELSAGVDSREKELQERRAEASGLHEELASALKQAETLKLEQQQLRSRVAGLERDLSQQKQYGAKDPALEQENERLRKELALSVQMQEGLKGQYDELEEKFSQLFEQFLQEQKKNTLNMPAPISTTTPTEASDQKPDPADPPAA